MAKRFLQFLTNNVAYILAGAWSLLIKKTHLQLVNHVSCSSWIKHEEKLKAIRTLRVELITPRDKLSATEAKIYSRTDIFSDPRLQRSKRGNNSAKSSEKQDMQALG